MNEHPKYNPENHHRRSIRLKGYDYTQNGAYFITLCTHQRQHLFGEIVNGEMRLNGYGEMVRDTWYEMINHMDGIELGEFVVMPNHIHGIIVICRGTACRAPTIDTPMVDAPTTDPRRAPTIDTPMVDAPTTDPRRAPTVNVPTVNVPTTDPRRAPTVNAPAIDVPTVNVPTTDPRRAPTVNAPAIDVPTINVPTTDPRRAPTVNAPAIDAPAINVPTTDPRRAPTVNVPTTDPRRAPTIDAPTVNAPTINVPTTDPRRAPMGMEQFGKPIAGSIPTIIRSFKSAVTKRINEETGTPGMPIWQRNYWEHIIRDEKSYQNIAAYILNNPAKWELDQLHPGDKP